MKTLSLKTKLMAVGLLGLGAWGVWHFAYGPSTDQKSSSGQATSAAAVSAVGSLAANSATADSPAQGLTGASGGEAGLKAPAGPHAAGTVGVAGADSASGAVSQAAINKAAAAQLQCATRLTGDQKVSDEKREQDLLGANPLDPALPAAGQMVTLQDRKTGQLSYRLAGVRVVLSDPSHGDAFIAGNADLSRLFVNSQYLDAAVPPSRLAAVLTKLQADQRVVSVDLMRYVAPVKAK